MKSPKSTLIIGIAALAIGLALDGSTATAGETCKDSAGNSPCTGTNSPCVCVERSDLNDPEEVTDFSFDVFTDPTNPDVTFKTGSSSIAWRVWSQVSASDTTPANLGDLFIDSSGSTDNFAVEILNPNECTGGICTAGAANLKSAVLDDATNWVGNSGISDGTISGNLTGDLEVVQDAAGGGGSVKLTVLGDTSGTLDIEAWSTAIP